MAMFNSYVKLPKGMVCEYVIVYHSDLWRVVCMYCISIYMHP